MSDHNGGVTIDVGGLADLDRLAPLWLAIHHRHQQAMPELAPYVDDERSWTERRGLYASLFAERSAHLLLAHDGDRLIGYGLAYTTPARETWLADTWQTGDVVGEIESLGVLPEYRGGGIGTRLLAGLHAYLDSQGVRDVVLGVLPGNVDARRLYERHGYRPTWMYLTRREHSDGTDGNGVPGAGTTPR